MVVSVNDTARSAIFVRDGQQPSGSIGPTSIRVIQGAGPALREHLKENRRELRKIPGCFGFRVWFLDWNVYAVYTSCGTLGYTTKFNKLPWWLKSVTGEMNTTKYDGALNA